jgi:hypothetical protein
MINDRDVKKFIQMSELCELLNTKDIRSATKWCEDKKITVFSLCNKRVTYRFMVEIELDKILIAQLKESNPETWEELYQCYQENNQSEYLNILNEKNKKNSFKTRSKPQSKHAKDFLNQLNMN